MTGNALTPSSLRDRRIAPAAARAARKAEPSRSASSRSTRPRRDGRRRAPTRRAAPRGRTASASETQPAAGTISRGTSPRKTTGSTTSTATSDAVRASRASAPRARRPLREPPPRRAARPTSDERQPRPRLPAFHVARSRRSRRRRAPTAEPEAARRRRPRARPWRRPARRAPTSPRESRPITFSSRSEASAPAASTSARNVSVSASAYACTCAPSSQVRPWFPTSVSPIGFAVAFSAPSVCASARRASWTNCASRRAAAARQLGEQPLRALEPEDVEPASEERAVATVSKQVDVLDVRGDVRALQLAVQRVDERLHLLRQPRPQPARRDLVAQRRASAPSRAGRRRTRAGRSGPRRPCRSGARARPRPAAGARARRCGSRASIVASTWNVCPPTTRAGGRWSRSTSATRGFELE